MLLLFFICSLREETVVALDTEMLLCMSSVSYVSFTHAQMFCPQTDVPEILCLYVCLLMLPLLPIFFVLWQMFQCFCLEAVGWGVGLLTALTDPNGSLLKGFFCWVWFCWWFLSWTVSETWRRLCDVLHRRWLTSCSNEKKSIQSPFSAIRPVRTRRHQQARMMRTDQRFYGTHSHQSGVSLMVVHTPTI